MKPVRSHVAGLSALRRLSEPSPETRALCSKDHFYGTKRAQTVLRRLRYARASGAGFLLFSGQASAALRNLQKTGRNLFFFTHVFSECQDHLPHAHSKETGRLPCVQARGDGFPPLREPCRALASTGCSLSRRPPYTARRPAGLPACKHAEAGRSSGCAWLSLHGKNRPVSRTAFVEYKKNKIEGANVSLLFISRCFNCL